LPELECPEVALQQALEEGLQDVVGILPVGAGADAVVNHAAVAPVERLERARRPSQDIVDQLDIRQVG